MTANIIDIAKVVDRQAATVERKLLALRKEQARRMHAIRQLEQACLACTVRMQQMVSTGNGAVTVQMLINSSQDAKLCESTLRELRKNMLELNAELVQIAAQRKTYCNTLLALRRKADYMRDRDAKEMRKAARRQQARENVSA